MAPSPKAAGSRAGRCPSGKVAAGLTTAALFCGGQLALLHSAVGGARCPGAEEAAGARRQPPEPVPGDWVLGREEEGDEEPVRPIMQHAAPLGRGMPLDLSGRFDGQLGGPFSFMCTIRVDVLRNWTRVFDFSLRADEDSITAGAVASTSDFHFTVFRGKKPSYAVAPKLFTLGEEFTLLCTVSASGHMRVFKDGVLKGENPRGQTPALLSRSHLTVGGHFLYPGQEVQGILRGVKVWDQEVTWAQTERERALAKVDAARLARWDFWPYGPGAASSANSTRVGIVTGGSSDLFGGSPTAYGDATACLMHMLAERRGYAFYAERAMQRYGAGRPVAWHKIRLLRERLADVGLLLWVDADIAWTAEDADLPDLFFRRLSSRDACVGHMGQARWRDVAGAAAGNGTDGGAIFLWSSADVRPKQEKNMNLNSAVLALRSGSLSRHFLDAVWAEGENFSEFTRHNSGWRKQAPGTHYFGWPFEQGAVWAVLDRERTLLERSCVVKAGVLHSVQYHRWKPGEALGAHMPGMPSEDRRKAACSHLATAVAGPGQCTAALRGCPDLFAGRLLAPHVPGLCAHCLGPDSGETPAPGSVLSGPEGASDFSQFDCGCLRPQAALA